MTKIIVDCDNTLWNFAEVFYDYIYKLVPNVPPLSEWSWEEPTKHLSKERMYKIIDYIHLRQDIFEPYPDAREFLLFLKQTGYEIVIASHRKSEFHFPLENFLKKNFLPYSSIHLSHDKTVLFPSAIAIIDDCPHILDKARDAGLITSGLLFPWNKHTTHKLYSNLMDVKQFLIGGN